MNEIIVEFINDGNVILYNIDLLSDVINELDSRNIAYNYKHYEQYVFFTNEIE